MFRISKQTIPVYNLDIVKFPSSTKKFTFALSIAIFFFVFGEIITLD